MKKPNILFLFPDQHRREWMPYDDAVFARWDMEKPQLHLPNISKLMENGVTFLNAITSSPLCAPARACLAAGVRYPRCETFLNSSDFPLSKPTIYKAIRDAGYNVYGTGKFDLRKHTCDWFNKENYDTLGFTKAIDNEGKLDAISSYKIKDAPQGPYMEFLSNAGLVQKHLDDFNGRGRQTYTTPLPDYAYCDNFITKNTIELIEQAPVEKPWFMQVNFTGPHDPFDVTERMYGTVKNREYEPPHNPQPEANSNEIRQCYAAMIENIDRNIGEIIDCIKKRGELDNTVIIYASDHGEMLGDHGKYAKHLPHRGSIGIPMIISHPNQKRKNRQEDAIIELQDLTSTIAQFAGADMPWAVDSIPLVSLINGDTCEHRAYGYCAIKGNKNKAGFKCVLNEKYKYIEYDDGNICLFNVQDDTWEDNNIAADLPDIIKEMRAALYLAENPQPITTERNG